MLGRRPVSVKKYRAFPGNARCFWRKNRALSPELALFRCVSSAFQSRKQSLGVAPVDRPPIFGRKPGVFLEAFVRQRIFSDRNVTAIKDLRYGHDIFQSVQRGGFARVRRVEVEPFDFVPTP